MALTTESSSQEWCLAVTALQSLAGSRETNMMSIAGVETNGSLHAACYL